MGELAYQHQDLASGRWAKMPINLQLSNIGSEVSRSLKWQTKGRDNLMNGAIDRALELFDLTIAGLSRQSQISSGAALREVCRAREEFCDYFFGENSFKTDPKSLQRYYDQFSLLS